ncbi:MAG TPA: OmpA family protein [Oscillatoriaceae cyanobacterium M7585_C2015_266]|nr:OmpA family protein [Oscillatoriaceae cyanobacterium M7585_C2015_266]
MFENEETETQPLSTDNATETKPTTEETAVNIIYQPSRLLPPAKEKEIEKLYDNNYQQKQETTNLLFLPEKNTQPVGADVSDSNNLNKPDKNLEMLAQQNADDLVNPLEQLQTLLLGSRLNEFDEFKDILRSIDHKLAHIERQIYDPQELKNLLLPWIAELLSIKVSESKQEVVNAIFPIIDELIRTKSQEDRKAMSAVIADLLPDAISQQISDSPEQLAKALAPEIAAAIKEQIRIEQDAIATAIAPAMGQAIKAQIEIERDAMVDALYPVIGNTISKYMVETVREINEKITKAFSYEGISRKIRAKLQGVSEAELILKESIPFTIQAIFLIHKSSGLVIAEVQRSDNQRLESEMVAGMLTAIRSFVNDCITQAGELNEIEYGDSKIILEVAGYCYIATVIKGEPPKEFIEKMRRTLGVIVLKYGKPIERYNGDPSEIPESVTELLQALMQFSLKKKDKKPPLALLSLVIVFSSLIIIPFALEIHRKNIERRIESATANALASVPELAVYRLGVDVEKDKLKLTGKLPNQQLRAKAEAIALRTVPNNLQVENKIVAAEVPPDPVAVSAEIKRVTAVFNQIEGVSISTRYHNNKVTIEGTIIDSEQGRTITQAFQQIPGVQSVVNTLTVKPLVIDSRIYFDIGSATLNPAYQPLIVKIHEVLNRYPQKSLKIIGHADLQGSPAINQKLALARAEAVREALLKRGVAPGRLQVVGKAQPPADVGSEQPQFLSRCVVFELMSQSKKKIKK